ncbi:MAG: type II 3-dehydroquinate dehydratase [Desulfohalobiaceae bacterium]
METANILVLNGPNLGVLGRREPEIYGDRSLHDLPDLVRDVMGEAARDVHLVTYQSNSEGGLIDRMEQALDEGVQGIALNAGAYTHTSLALADCLAWIDIPCVEVHLSNVWARQEPLRHTSMIAPRCVGVVSGFGLWSYAYAVLALHQLLRQEQGS